MRVLVCVHALDLGGSQLNAIELAGGVRDRGHEVTLVGFGDEVGAAEEIIEARGLPFVRLPDASRAPRHARRRLTDLATSLRADVVHAYEWPQALNAFYGPHLRLGTPLVMTVLTMTVPTWLPASPTLVVGTRGLATSASARRRGRVAVIEPRVDTDADAPDFDPAGFRSAHGVADDATAVVVVSRLAFEMKLEGIEDSIRAVELLPRDANVQLVIVGDGPAYRHLRDRALDVNSRLGRQAVVLTGALTDPRPAYASADIVVGMGTSAIRGLAFAKPVIVLGENGFAELVDNETLPQFLHDGFFGIGRGEDGGVKIAFHLSALLAGASDRRALGAWGRGLVERQFGLRQGAVDLEHLYREAVASRPAATRRWTDAARSSAHRGVSSALPDSARDSLRRLLRSAS